MKTVRVKICGITRKSDAVKAVACGAWALGFVFTPESPRYVDPRKAAAIIRALPPFITPVGVFVNQKEREIRKIAALCGIQTLQFHGDESPAFCRKFGEFKVIKAIRVGQTVNSGVMNRYRVDALLFDTHAPGLYGGTGRTFDWSLAGKSRGINRPLILSGGLNPGNIGRAVRTVRPFAVDVSSGVEARPGVKDGRLLEKLFERIRKI